MGQAQFLRYEAFSLAAKKGKRSAFQIANEAMRVRGFCNHVLKPEPPEIIFGEDVRKVVSDFEQVKDSLRDRGGKKLRCDALVVLGGIIGGGDRPITQEFADDCVAHLKEEFGSSLRSVLLHRDEPPHEHLHFYCIPDHEHCKAFNIDSVHAGIKAKNECKGTAKQKDIAYKRAMQKVNERFYNNVSVKHGFLLKSVQRERIRDRNEYFQHKRQIDAIAGEKKMLKSKAKALKEKRIDLRIQNMQLINAQYSFERDFEENKLLKSELLRKQQALSMEKSALLALQQEAMSLKDDFKKRLTGFINGIIKKPNEIKDMIIKTLTSENEKIMSTLSELEETVDSLKSELKNALFNTNNLSKKYTKLETKNTNLVEKVSKLQELVSYLKESRLEALKHLNNDRLEDAKQSLTDKKNKEEDEKYAGYEPQTGLERMGD